MQQDPFTPPKAAFTRSVPIRFSHCDPAGIVYFPQYFNMFNGLIEDWYTEEVGYNYAEIVMGSQLGFPLVHIECDFKVPSRMGDLIHLTLLVERIGRSSLGIAGLKTYPPTNTVNGSRRRCTVTRRPLMRLTSVVMRCLSPPLAAKAMSSARV